MKCKKCGEIWYSLTKEGHKAVDEFILPEEKSEFKEDKRTHCDCGGELE